MAGSKNPDAEEAKWNNHHTPKKSNLTSAQEAAALGHLTELGKSIGDISHDGTVTAKENNRDKS